MKKLVPLGHFPRLRFRERQPVSSGVKQRKHPTEPALVTDGSIHAHANRNLRNLTRLVKRHRQRLRRTLDFNSSRLHRTREHARVRANGSILKPHPVRLERVDAEGVVIALHVGKSSGQVEPTDRVHERIFGQRAHDWADELKVIRELIANRSEAGAQARLTARD